MNLDYDIFVIQSDNKKIKICFETKKIDTQMPFNTNEYYNIKIIYEGSVQK